MVVTYIFECGYPHIKRFFRMRGHPDNCISPIGRAVFDQEGPLYFTDGISIWKHVAIYRGYAHGGVFEVFQIALCEVERVLNVSRELRQVETHRPRASLESIVRKLDSSCRDQALQQRACLQWALGSHQIRLAPIPCPRSFLFRSLHQLALLVEARESFV